MERILRWCCALVLSFCALGSQASETPLGPGDVIKISVFGNPDLSLETKVSEIGAITFPFVGQVEVGGLTTFAAEKKIANLLETGGFIRNPQVNIAVTLLQSQQVSILGHVNRPGRYPIDGKRSLTDLLALAGGINGEGGDTITLIRKRNGKTTKETVDLVDMVRSGDMSQNIDLVAGDLIFVERAPRFYIYGEVQRPGFYRLERNMTVLQALAAGGGITPRGTERNVRVKRRDSSGQIQVIEVQHSDSINADDTVYVQESLF